MSRRGTAAACALAAALAAIGVLASRERGSDRVAVDVAADGAASGAPPPAARPGTPALGEAIVATARRARDERGPERGAPSRAAEPAVAPADRDASFWRDTAEIEDFKQAIYALEIDTIDEIPKLDPLVHVDVEDPRDLWETDWSGVDDWKRYRDGFSLERGPDGSLLFLPGEETQRMFTFFEGISLYEWDDTHEAFVNQVDYYGKPIYNVVKFLREDVLVMMTISGQKVDLNIFEQGNYR